MLKRQILSLFLLINSVFFAFPGKSDNHQQKFNPSNTVIAWDYHDVLVKKDWSSMVYQIGDILKKDWKMVGLIFWVPFWIKVIQTNKTTGNAEELIDKLSTEYPSLGSHSKAMLNLINLHTPIENSVEILKQLKTQGYKNYLASNIGERSLKIQQERYSDIFNQFDGFYIPQRKQNSNLFISKPNKEYYIGLHSYLNESDKNIVFIDDKIKNIQGANKCNRFHGIRFNSPEQLKSDLDNLLQVTSMES